MASAAAVHHWGSAVRLGCVQISEASRAKSLFLSSGAPHEGSWNLQMASAGHASDTVPTVAAVVNPRQEDVS